MNYQSGRGQFLQRSLVCDVTNVAAQVGRVTAIQMGVKISQITPSHTYYYRCRATTLV